MSARLEVVPGPGTVIRHGSVAVWAGPLASPALLEFLVRSCRNLAPSGRGGLLLAAHVAGVLGERDPEPAAPFATVGPDGDGAWTVLLHGATQLWDGITWHRVPVPPGWVQRRCADSGVLLVGALGARPDPGSSHPLLDLETGAVPGGGFALVTAAPVAGPVEPAGAPDGRPNTVAPAAGGPVPGDTAPGDTTPGDTVLGYTAPDEPVAVGSVDESPAGPDGSAAPGDPGPPDEPTLVLGGDATSVMPVAAGATVPPDPDSSPPGDPTTTPGRPPGVIGLLPAPSVSAPMAPTGLAAATPVVRGLRCPAGHFNHPGAAACARCGRRIEARERVVSGPRPALGVLVVDDGSIWRLDRSYLLGAHPDEDPTVTGGTARGLAIGGDRVADAHAELRLADWAVTVVDRGSPGGTWVLDPGGSTWEQLEPYRQHLLRPGSHLAVGARVLTYVSAWPG